jgi:hypothetical protein
MAVPALRTVRACSDLAQARRSFHCEVLGLPVPAGFGWAVQKGQRCVSQ